MKKNLIPIILFSLSCILFIASIILVVNSNYFSLKNQTQNQDNSETQIKEEQTSTNEEQKQENTKVEESKQEENKTNKEESKKEENTSTKDETTSNKTETPKTETTNKEETKKEESSTNNNTVVETPKNENDIINYFSLKDSDMKETTDQDDRTLREKAKDTFVTVVDFIFYDKEIKGYTFKELTTNAKLKVIEIALSIDNKIDEYFPDYKDVIKDKYENIKGKLAVKYLEFTSALCEKVGTDTCSQAKEDFNNMKEKFSITWQLIKELASNGSNKVKEFYESWRDSK